MFNLGFNKHAQNNKRTQFHLFCCHRYSSVFGAHRMGSDDSTDINSLYSYMKQEFAKINEFIGRIDCIIEKQTHLENKLEAVVAVNSSLKDEVIVLKKTVNSMEQSNLAGTLIFNSLPDVEENSDELTNLIKSTCTALGVTDSTKMSVTRLGKSEKNGMRILKRPVQVRFENVEVAAKIIQAKRRKKLNYAEISYKKKPLGKADEPVYIQEKLTKYNSHLLYVLRSMVRKEIIKHGWVTNGQVYARVLEEGNVIRIGHEEDIYAMIVECGLEELCSNLMQKPRTRANKKTKHDTLNKDLRAFCGGFEIPGRTRSGSRKRVAQDQAGPNSKEMKR